jgi:hypothetical protein
VISSALPVRRPNFPGVLFGSTLGCGGYGTGEKSRGRGSLSIDVLERHTSWPILEVFVICVVENGVEEPAEERLTPGMTDPRVSLGSE